MKHILLAEDDFDYASILRQYLEISGFKVTWAKDGADALSLYPEAKPDICVFDVMMPKMDGFTFVKTFKSKYSLEATPILVLTGRSGMKEPFELEGVRAFLTKPCTGDDLLGKIKAILR